MVDPEQIPNNNSFTELMDEAQELHGKGHFVAAQPLWQAAEEIAPNDLERGRAIRGDGATANMRGDHQYALERAAKAHALHDGSVRNALVFAEETNALRERGQSSSVLGRFTTATIIRQERAGLIDIIRARHAAQKGLAYLDGALKDIEDVEARTGRADQYRINVLSHLAIAQELYGDPYAAVDLAHQARTLAWQSENQANPTSAQLSRGNQVRAVARAVVRSYSATVLNAVATQHRGPRRSMALALASNQRLGL